jgi:hypothetical protein
MNNFTQGADLLAQWRNGTGMNNFAGDLFSRSNVSHKPSIRCELQ